MQDVGDQQFLMLLFVIETDFENLKDARGVGFRHVLDQPLDRGIDMRAIAGDFRRRSAA